MSAYQRSRQVMLEWVGDYISKHLLGACLDRLRGSSKQRDVVQDINQLSLSLFIQLTGVAVVVDIVFAFLFGSCNCQICCPKTFVLVIQYNTKDECVHGRLQWGSKHKFSKCPLDQGRFDRRIMLGAISPIPCSSHQNCWSRMRVLMSGREAGGIYNISSQYLGGDELGQLPRILE